MTADDIKLVLPLYLEYYNGHEDACWTEETAARRIRQVITVQDGYSLLLEDAGEAIGFAMGYFKQYDDLLGYTLEEILVASAHQNRGVGSWFLSELEREVHRQGATLMELISVNDEMHDRFYGKAGYYKSTTLLPRGKWLK